MLLQYMSLMIIVYCPHYFINIHDQFDVLYIRTQRLHWTDPIAYWRWQNKESNCWSLIVENYLI